MNDTYEYQGSSILVIIQDPRVRRALADAWDKFPDSYQKSSPKIERIKYLRGVVHMGLKEAKDVVEYVETRPYLFKEWGLRVSVRKLIVFQYVDEDNNFSAATLVTSNEQLDVVREFYSKLPSHIKAEYKLRIFNEERVY